MLIDAENHDELPVEIYKAQVDSMFSDAKTLAIGCLASTGVTLYAAAKYQSPEICCIAAAMPVIGVFRLYAMHLYGRIPLSSSTHENLRKWEILYVIGASLHVLLCGAFVFVTFRTTEDSFGRLASFAGLMAYLVGIPGRNFASNLLVNVLIACGGIPVMAALLLAGYDYWVIGLIVLAPFFWGMRTISVRLRGVFLDAVFRARDVSRLASRFDSALNNMPCGLAMLDKKGRVVVTNRRLTELLKIAPGAREKPENVEDILVGSVAAGAVNKEQAKEVANGIRVRMKGGAFEELLFELTNGRVLSLTLQPMENGGAVVLFDDVTERNIAQARINELARFDPLTGLPNRFEFHDRVSQILSSRDRATEVAMLFIDLDQFKQVNDSLGHAVGDQLLGAVADRLRWQASPNDLIARLGGDEFVVLLRSAKDHEHAEQTSCAIIAELSKPYEIDSNHIVLGASIGIAMTPDVPGELDALLRCADMALYQAKADGRGIARFFEHGMEIKARMRRELEFDLRNALDNDELELHYQPIFNVAKRRFLGCEALVRWRHATRGLVSPGVFVPIAEEMGLILRLDDWVLRKACIAAANWPRDIKIAVNVSAVHFRDPRIVDSVKAALRESNLSPSRLEIEITETALLQNMQMTRSVLHELRKLGVRISLDDFGTGYSSLSYLHTLPLNKIKIDRSFLFGLEEDSRALKLLSGITRLSKDLGLSIVMEGVETHEQLAMVTRNTPVDEIQGFLFSGAIPQAEITALFDRKQRFAA